MKYIHLKCLLHWLKTKIKIDKSEYIENDYFSLYSPENVQCELCKEYFPHFLKHNSQLLNLTELEQNYESDLKEENKKNDNNTDKNNENININENYIVLDSMSPDKEIIPYRYIVKFSKNKILKIGRGLDMNLILNDLSISRNHCQLELNDNGDIFLKDNNSKFGTLILVQAKSLEILKGQMLTVQTGRTYFNINYKTNFSLFGCCNPEEIDLRSTYEKMNFKHVKIEKNCVVLTESESEGEKEYIENDKNLIDEDKKEENEYENNIKKLNNKKIKIMKIGKKDNKKNETNTKSVNDNIHINKNIIKDERNITEQKKDRNNSKKKIVNLNKSLDDKDNIEDNDINKENKKKNNNKKKEDSNEKNNENKNKTDNKKDNEDKH